MDVFEAFPNAIISGVWELGEVQRATEVGNVFESYALCDVIIEEGTYDRSGQSPNADYQDSNILLYARPGDMPTLNSAALAASYYWHNTETDQYYAITECSMGTNQELGIVEHLEFLLKPTEVANV